VTHHPTTYFKISAIVLLLVTVAAYTLFQTRNLIAGPVIAIHTPTNGATVLESLVTIEGIAHNISYISLNDRQIFIDEKGKFSELLLLSYGYNIMTIAARDKFGRETEEILELIYK